MEELVTTLAGLLSEARQRHHPLIVAELGAKYAPLPVMLDAVRAAKAAGADMVKFQTFRADALAASNAVFKGGEGRAVSQQEYFARYELGRDDHRELVALCRSCGVPWCSTPSSAADIELLEDFDPLCYKTGSDDLTNVPLLRAIARTGRPVVISTGMSTLEEVALAVNTVRGAGGGLIVLLHCVVSYPSKVEDANLRAMATLRDKFNCPVGLSDHTPDDFTSVVAAVLGAEVIEKHFTPDHALNLPDDQVSLDPGQLSELVRRVRSAMSALGDGTKRVTEDEKEWRGTARKSLYAARDIKAGEVIRAEDLCVLRPLADIEARWIDSVVGRAIRQPALKGEPLRWDMF